MSLSQRLLDPNDPSVSQWSSYAFISLIVHLGL